MKFKNPFSRKPKFMLQNDHIIKEAFTCGGVTYYAFDDIYNQPYERALTALDFYEEFRMRTSFDFLKLHTAAVDDILSNPKTINVGTIHSLNKQLKERLDWIVSPDLLYKLASVVYFDKNESPYVYDHKYGADKIKHWKKHSEMNAFFLQQPIIKLHPFLADCEVDFQSYSILVKKLEATHLENIITKLSPQMRNSDYVKDLISRLETQQN
jgi:hypothetical protein